MSQKHQYLNKINGFKYAFQRLKCPIFLYLPCHNLHKTLT